MGREWEPAELDPYEGDGHMTWQQLTGFSRLMDAGIVTTSSSPNAALLAASSMLRFAPWPCLACRVAVVNVPASSRLLLASTRGMCGWGLPTLSRCCSMLL